MRGFPSRAQPHENIHKAAAFLSQVRFSYKKRRFFLRHKDSSAVAIHGCRMAIREPFVCGDIESAHPVQTLSPLCRPSRGLPLSGRVDSRRRATFSAHIRQRCSGSHVHAAAPDYNSRRQRCSASALVVRCCDSAWPVETVVPPSGRLRRSERQANVNKQCIQSEVVEKNELINPSLTEGKKENLCGLLAAF